MTSRCSSSSQDSPFHRYSERTGMILTQAARFFSSRLFASAADSAGGTVDQITQISGAPPAVFFSMQEVLPLPAHKYIQSCLSIMRNEINSRDASANDIYLC